MNDTFSIYDLGIHSYIKATFLKNHRKYGISSMNYEPAIFDHGAPKFIWVRQKYSGSYLKNNSIPKNLKNIDLNLNKFYGKYI